MATTTATANLTIVKTTADAGRRRATALTLSPHRHGMKRLLDNVAIAIAAALFAVSASGELIIELNGTDEDGTLATFTGSGTTAGAFEFNIDAHEIGNFVLPTGPDNQWFDLVDPVLFAPGITIERFHVDHNPIPTLDDLRIGMSDFVVSGVSFNVSGSSLIEGLTFSSLIPGTYADSTRPDVGIVGGVTLIIHPYVVSEPASLALLGLGLAGLVLSRRRSRRLVGDV